MAEREPCPGCKRFHRGPRHKPAEALSVNLNVTVPRWLADRMDAQLRGGSRSAYVRALVLDDLEVDE